METASVSTILPFLIFMAIPTSASKGWMSATRHLDLADARRVEFLVMSPGTFSMNMPNTTPLASSTA